MDYIPTEKAQVIRYPSTANLMIDSADRASGRPWNFQINKPNSILNGFFTRIGTTEVILEWFYGNSEAIQTIDVTNDNTSTTETIDIAGAFGDPGFLTYAQALELFVSLCNTAFGYAQWIPGTAAPNTGFYIETNLAPSASPSGVGVGLNVGGVATDLEFNGPGCAQMGFIAGLAGIPFQPIYVPDLRAIRYLDFVSSQLTYNQDLKDSATNTVTRDVLCRWYFAWDTQTELDQYGFPILMGYTPFTARRIFNPPKQIRWDSIQPIGQLAFEVYDNNNNLFSQVDATSASNWLMTLQVSEV